VVAASEVMQLKQPIRELEHSSGGKKMMDEIMQKIIGSPAQKTIFADSLSQEGRFPLRAVSKTL